MLKSIWKILLLALSPIAAQAATYTITASNFEFDPPSVTINVGDTVTWVNGGGYHNVVADDNSYVNGAPSSAKWSFSHTFTAAGTSRFFCAPHGGPGGVGMSGIITIKSVATTPAIALGGYMSGNWYNPSQAGHGYELEFTSQASSTAGQNLLDVYWYAYTPDGSAQNWIFAYGPYDATSSTVTVPAYLFTGAKFPTSTQFDANAIQQTSWGTLTFTFSDCNNGTATWTSTVPGYGSGSIPISRLTNVAGTSCPAQ